MTLRLTRPHAPRHMSGELRVKSKKKIYGELR